MSVLFTAAASTRTSTSPASGTGRGQSSYGRSISGPPCPVSTTAFICPMDIIVASSRIAASVHRGSACSPCTNPAFGCSFLVCCSGLCTQGRQQRTVVAQQATQEEHAGQSGRTYGKDRPQGGGELWEEHENPHDQNKYPKSLTQDCFGHPRGQKCTDEGPDDRDGGDRGQQGPVHTHRGHVSGQSGKGLHRDHEQRSSHGGRHGQTNEQRKGRHHEEAAPGSDEPGDHPDHRAVEDDPSKGKGSRFLTRSGKVVLPSAEHAHGGGHHHEGEGDHQ